jgi:hypothetical protein
MKKLLEILGLVLLLACAVLLAKELDAQTVPAPPVTQPNPGSASAVMQATDLQALIAREFGESYKVATDIAPVYGDFDHDGKQDVIVVATGNNPLMGEGKYNYKTLDPYNASFGYGNPKVMMSFNASDKTARYLLVLHNWQTPGRKFVLVNIPFIELRLGHMLFHKKPVDAVEAVDSSGVQAAIYFDGKKYRWEVIGTEADR